MLKFKDYITEGTMNESDALNSLKEIKNEFAKGLAHITMIEKGVPKLKYAPKKISEGDSWRYLRFSYDWTKDTTTQDIEDIMSNIESTFTNVKTDYSRERDLIINVKTIK